MINLILKEINKIEETQQTNIEFIKILKELDKIFLCFYSWNKLNKKLLDLINKREKLRQRKKFEEADKIRDFLKEKFIYIQDTKSGPIVINLN